MNWTVTDFAPGEFARTRRKPPAQTGKMTKTKLAALIRAGYGQGHFQRYKPWLRVTKRDYSPNSLISHLPTTRLGRHHHPRADAERSTMQLVKWLGAADVRDAFPVWPWTHAHPGFGLPGFEGAPKLPGLQEVADEARLRLYPYPGTDLPYIHTLDILVTWRNDNGTYRLVACENKPEEITYAPEPLSRAKAKLQLTGLYCDRAGIPRKIVHAEKFPAEFIVNLNLLEPHKTDEELEDLTGSDLYREVVELLNARGHETPPFVLLGSLRQRRDASPEAIDAALHLALWRQDVDHDLHRPLEPWLPLQRGGRQLKALWMQALAGGAQ
jgi:hypothetical protein